MGLYSWALPGILDTLATGGTMAVGAAAGMLYAFQRRLIYIPQFPPGSRQALWKPTQYGWKSYEDVWLESKDGVRIHAFWIPCADGGESSAPTIYFCQANAGNMGHRLPLLQRLVRLFPCNIFMISYRGYGLSEGYPDEKGIKMDAQSGLDWLLKKESYIDKEKLFLYGQSIGGAVAINLASRNPGTFRGLILENTFTSMADVIPGVIPVLRYFTWLCHQRWESFTELSQMEEKPRILFLTGLKDELIPPEHSTRLKNVVPDAKQVTFAHGTHNDTCVQDGYFEAIADWLRETIITSRQVQKSHCL